MAITTVDSLGRLLETSDKALRRARDAGRVVWLVVPSHAWAQQRKMLLRKIMPTGINILTHEQLIAQLWDSYGDGSILITDLQRRVLLRPLVKQSGLLDSSPSPGLIDQLCAFVREASIPGLEPSSDLSDSEAACMEVVSLYERKLELEGLIDCTTAEAYLIQMGACAGMELVYEQPDLHSAHMRLFIASLEQCAQVTVVQERFAAGHADATGADELETLRARLFSGGGDLSPQGAVYVGEALGAHVAPELIVQMIERLHDADGIPYRDMVLCQGPSARNPDRLYQELARAGVPFEAQLSTHCARTGLGGAFHDLIIALREDDERHAFPALVDVACSPYAGISAQDGRALQMRWRERAHSTYTERIQDIFEGFAQGNATAADMKERLRPLAELIQAAPIERVQRMFAHAKDAHIEVNALLDDRAAAETLLDYLETCERFSCEPDDFESANLPVVLSRSYGNSEDALAITTAGSLGLAAFQAVILTDLDAQQYPMASAGAPFDALMKKLGIERADTLANDQRLMLQNTLEACGSRFAFMRATHDAAGDECCQSALFEELLAVYRTQQDEDEELPLSAVPRALRSQLISMSEAEAFFGCEDAVELDSIVRGSLESPASSAALVADAKGNPLYFSPTALEDYYRCPYRWFACRRVGYNGMDKSFDPASQGNLVHAVLERFYRELFQTGHTRVTPDNLAMALALASDTFDRQVEREAARAKSGLFLRSKYDELTCEALRGQVLEIVERDASFLPGFAPTYFELELGRKDAPLSYAGVPVRGKVDRIDVDPQGNAIIIDYKLSGLSKGYGFSKGRSMPERIQTDIYALLVQRHFEMLGIPIRVIGSVYRSYAHNNLRGVYESGIAWGEEERVRQDLDALPNASVPSTYQEYLVHVENEVLACMERLRSGDIVPAPLAQDACEYCKARSFCPLGGA